MSMIKVNDIDLYYECHGSGEPLVLIAGFSGDHTAWQSVIEKYSTHYQIIILDNRGSGSSKSPDYPYTTELMADDIAILLAKLNIGQTHILGHSFGGCIAQAFAYKYPDLVKSIIIVNSFLKPNMRLQLYVDARLKFMQSTAPDAAVTMFIASLCWSNDYLSQPGIIKQMVEAGFFPITIEGYINQAAALMEFNSTSWINQIKAPCLIISGSEDLLSDLQDAEFMVRAIPNAQHFCFHNVGHVAYIEQPEIFDQVVLSFLANKLA